MLPQLQPFDEHNRALRDHAHPADWKNPKPAPRYNLVVIGAGTAGLVTAMGAAGLGAKVALIERDLMGGDCLNVGCVPSKALIRAARSAAEVRNAGQFGIGLPGEPSVDFSAIMERMRRLRASIGPNDSASRFQKSGVDVFFGTAKFVASDVVEVAGERLRFVKAVIATGARATKPNIPGIEDVGYLTNETVFSLTGLPNRLAVIGAGPIGCELAQAFARFGSKVEVISNSDRIMPREDRDAGEIVRTAMERDGVQFHFDAQIENALLRDGCKVLAVKSPTGRCEFIVDEILVGIGRTPNIAELGLETVGVDFDGKRGVHVNDRLLTTNSKIFAAGDVCSRFQFTHAADAMARIVIQNSLFHGRAKASALTIPWCTFSDPEIAHVGMYESEAAERGIAVATFEQRLHEVDRAILDGETEGFVRVHVRRGTDQIVGATIVARHAGEMIGELALAMTANIGLSTIAKTIHPYPTQAEAIKKVADGYNRTRLTPFVKSLFAKWLAWSRR